MAYASVASLMWTEDGDDYQADFEVNGASSASNTLRIATRQTRGGGQGKALVRRQGKGSMNPLNPIVPTRLETKIWDKDRTLWNHIDPNDNDDIAFVVQKNSTIWFTGTLDRVEGGERVRRDSPLLTLVWDNGLPVLRGKTFSEQERAEMLEALWYILESTPDSFDTRASLAFKHPDAAGSNHTKDVGFDLDRMGTGTSYWDVLSQMLRKFNMQIWQADDAEHWKIVQRSYRDGTYEYEERTASSGSESTGNTTDPSVTITNSDWAEDQDGNRLVKRDKVSPSSWEERYDFEWLDWRNPDFSTDVTEPISGNTVPEGFHLDGSAVFDPANDQITLKATADGYAEQVWDQVLVETSQAGFRFDDAADQFDITASGTIEVIGTSESGTVDVPVLEVTAHSANATEYMDEGKQWSTTQQYVKATVDEYNQSTGTVERSFDISLTSIPLDVTADNTEVYIRIRLTTTSQDPDGDGNTEVEEVRWDSVNVGNLKRNVAREFEPMGSAASKVNVGDSTESEQTQIGATWLNIDTPASNNQDAENPAGAIRYKDSTSGDLLLPENTKWNHATRAYSDYLENIRLLDKYAQHSEDILRVRGLIDKDAGVKFGSTVTWDSKTWVPVMIKETIKEKYKEVVLVQLKDRDTSGASVQITDGSFSSSTGAGAGGGGGGSGGGGGGTSVSSVQQRTGSVEFASEDAGPGLEINTGADPNQIRIQSEITDMALQVNNDAGDWFVAKVTNDSDSDVFRFLDSGDNQLGTLAVEGLDGAGAGRFEVQGFDEARIGPATTIGSQTQSPNAPLHVAGNSRIEGSMHVGGDSAPSETLHVAGTSQFDGDVTLGMSTQNFVLTGRGDNITYDPQGSAKNSFLEIFSTDGDGSNRTGVQIFSKHVSGPSDISDRENMLLEWFSNDSRWRINTNSGGAESTSAFAIEVGSNSDQLVCRTDGDVAMANSLKVGGTGSPAYTLDVTNVARAQTRFRSPETRTDATFSAGWTGSGWKMSDSQNGKSDALELSNLVVRETLRVFELEVRDITFTRGPLGVTPGGGKLEDVSSSTHTAVTNTYDKWSITAVDTTNDTVDVDNTTVSADPATDLNNGQDICITGSTGNDGNYTVSSTTDNGDGTTTIAVNETIGDSTTDGQVQEAKQQVWTFENKNNDGTKPGLSQGDRLLAQRFNPDTQNVITQVRAVVDETSSQDGTLSAYQFNVTVDSERTIPADGADTEGYEFIVNASSDTGRDSFLYFDPYAPAGSAFDGVSDFDDWDARADLIRYRWGRLDSWYDYGSSASAYGMAAGDPNGTWIGIDDNNGMRVFTGGTTKMIEFTTGGTGYIRDLLSVNDTVWIGEDISTKNAADRLLIGRWDPGTNDDLYVRARGTDGAGGANLIQMSSSNSDLFRVQLDGTTMLQVSNSSGIELFDSNGTLSMQFDMSGDAFIKDVLQVGTGAFVGNNLSNFNAQSRAYVGFWNDGSQPRLHLRAGNSTGGANFFRVADFGSSSSAFVTIDVDGTTMFDIVPDDGVSLYDSTGTRMIHFDTSGNAFFKGEVEIDGSGALTMDTPGGVKEIDIDQSTSFSSLPTKNTSESNESSIASEDSTSVNLTTGTDWKSHEAVVTVENQASSNSHDIIIEVYESSSKSTLLGSQTFTSVGAGNSVTANIDHNPNNVSSVYVEARFGATNTGDNIKITDADMHYWEHFIEINTKGTLFGLRNDSFLAVKDGVPRVGDRGMYFGGQVDDANGRLFEDGSGNIKWEDFTTGTVTQLN